MTNEELYQEFLDGNEQSLAKLIEELGNALIFYIYGYTNSFEDAEDIMIDAFAYIATKRPVIRHNGFKAYLYKTAKHMAIKTVKKNEKNFYIQLETMDYIEDEKMLISEMVSTNERNDILHACMSELNGDYREALYLVYFEGLSHKEAACVMNKREKQVSDLIYRGRKSLKVKLQREGFSNV